MYIFFKFYFRLKKNVAENNLTHIYYCFNILYLFNIMKTTTLILILSIALIVDLSSFVSENFIALKIDGDDRFNNTFQFY